jgi:outer membrane beta-barrel protein
MRTLDVKQTTGSRWKRRVLALAVALLTVGLSATAFAQNGGGDNGDQDLPGGPLEEKLSDYWSVDRDVAVIRDKLYRRKGRVGIGLHAGFFSSEPFYWYIPVGARFDYYFTDYLGLTIEGSYTGSFLQQQTDLASFVEESKGENHDLDTSGMDQYKWRANALVTWHPLYGKFSLLQRKLSHFDINLAAGFGAVSVTRPDDTRSTTTDEIVPEFAFGGGIDFFVSNHVLIRLNARGYLYPGAANYVNDEGDRTITRQGDGVEEANFFQRLEFNAEFLAGVTYLF